MRRIDPWFAIGLFAFFALLFVALFGERIAPYESIYMVVDPPVRRPPYAPGEVYPFGSDALGRDLFSVVLAGARATLIIATIAGAARVILGLVIAIAASWWRPMRVIADSLAEIVSAVPATLVALLVVLVFVRGDPQIFTFVGALLITGWAGPIGSSAPSRTDSSARRSAKAPSRSACAARRCSRDTISRIWSRCSRSRPRSSRSRRLSRSPSSACSAITIGATRTLTAHSSRRSRNGAGSSRTAAASRTFGRHAGSSSYRASRSRWRRWHLGDRPRHRPPIPAP